jgi:actin-related protein
MSGLEIFGAVGAAATLIELAKKCSARLEKGRRTHQDLVALQERVDLLAETTINVSNVLENIRRRYEEHAPITQTEIALWQHMEAVLKTYHKDLAKLDNRLELVLQKKTRNLAVIPQDITRRAEDVKTYISALGMLQGLFTL